MSNLGPQDESMILYSGATDVGNIRPNNEDVFDINPTQHYCLVADGMGGAAAGEVASRIFADSARVVFAGHDGLSEKNTIARIHSTFKLANDTMIKHVERNPHDHGMGCTAELLAFTRQSFIIGHVGDSRTYRVRNKTLEQLTKDHSMVQDQLDKGLITAQEARGHALRNVILRAVGTDQTVALDILKGKKKPGHLFLLCSDGLTDMVEESSVLATLCADGTLDDKTNMLIQLAKRAGGRDNITVVLSAIG